MEHRVFDFAGAEFVGAFENGSAEWHEARKGSLGGSQVGAVLGLNPWESAVTCYYKVRGEIDSHIEPSMSMRIGTALETPILGLFEAEHPDLKVFTTGTYRSVAEPWMNANVDGIWEEADGSRGVIEVKFSSDWWSEPPRHYVAQVNWYMHILGLDCAVIVALCGSAYKEFWIRRDQFVIDSMLARVREFWVGVESGVRPAWDGSDSTYKTMRELNKDIVAGDVELGDDGLQLWGAALALDAAKSEYNLRASVVLDKLGDNKNGLVNGERFCYRQNSSAGTPFLKLVKGK